jgi:hypothetical protein
LIKKKRLTFFKTSSNFEEEQQQFLWRKKRIDLWRNFSERIGMRKWNWNGNGNEKKRLWALKPRKNRPLEGRFRFQFLTNTYWRPRPSLSDALEFVIFDQHLLTALSVNKCFAGNKTDNALPNTETALFFIIRNYFLTA